MLLPVKLGPMALAKPRNSGIYCRKMLFYTDSSVAARLGKGQGAKEIEHNLTRERPKIGHNLVRERQKFCHNPARERNEVWAQFCGRLMKTWLQICKHFTSIFTSAVRKHKNSNYICKNKKNKKMLIYF